MHYALYHVMMNKVRPGMANNSPCRAVFKLHGDSVRLKTSRSTLDTARRVDEGRGVCTCHDDKGQIMVHVSWCVMVCQSMSICVHACSMDTVSCFANKLHGIVVHITEGDCG